MSVRQRTRRTQARTEDRAWQRRREDVIEDHPELETTEEFWRREPGIPAELRRPVHRRYLMATNREDIERLRAEYDAAHEARRRWLRASGFSTYMAR